MHIAIGIIARNEEAGIGPMLGSVFAQSIFHELKRRGQCCEILCLANACTDRTAGVAANTFRAQKREHPDQSAFRAHLVELPERGKINAWNQFVHGLSARDAQFLFLMDADILIHQRETLLNMLRALEGDAYANIAIDRPCKDVLFKPRKSLRDRLSLAASRMTAAGEAQLCGQLYCIRAEVARRIYLPKDLVACDDGFIKALVCSDFLTRASDARRITLAQGAEHTFEAYLSPQAIVKNQKRQIMGQAMVHVLVDGYLKSLPASDRASLGEKLREMDRTDPTWLKRLMDEHLQRKQHWWELYPGLAGTGFARMKRFNLGRRLACFPAAVAGSSLSMISGRLAFAALKAGCTDYWPEANRQGLNQTLMKD